MYWFAAQQQTNLVARQKFGQFYVKFSVESNELGLFFLKTIGSGPKMVKTKVIRKNAKRRHSEAKS